MIEVKRAIRPAKPAVCCLFLPDDHVEAGRDTLILDVHNFPAMTSSAYKSTKQPTSEENLPPRPTSTSRQLAVKIRPHKSGDSRGRWGHGGGGAWDPSSTLRRFFYIPCAVYMVKVCWHFVFDDKMQAKMHNARLIIVFENGITHDMV